MQAYAYKPSKPMKIKSVKDLYARWQNAKMKVTIRPDAVCTQNNAKNKSIYHKQLTTYKEAARVILDNLAGDYSGDLNDLEMLREMVNE